MQESYTYGDREWPIAPFRDYVIDTIANNPVTVLSSGTGNGKSIFMPQALHESGHFDMIYITQPRIVATRENTEFTRYQMEQATGHNMSSVIGYTTATEGDKLTTQRIRSHTDGYMVQKLINPDPKEVAMFRNPLLIVDEAHERNANIDIAIALSNKSGMRLLIQSASMDAERVAEYCSQARGGIEVPLIDVPGVMHKVDHLNGGELHDEIIRYANLDSEKPLNIMALIPGKREYQEAMSRIMKKVPKGYTVLALNGDQTIEEQRRSFQTYPRGKIVISTEVGRQSITIPDLDVVLDGGYQRSGDYRQGVRSLRIKPTSRAGIIQGKGRVGRTKPGVYVQVQLPGYPPIPKNSEGELIIDRFDTPPIQRTDPAPYALRLAQTALRLDEIGLQNEPLKDEIEYAHHKLIRLGAQALNCDALTEIGSEMQRLPLDPTYARMLVEARKYGKSVELQMAAMVCVCQQDGITMTEKYAEQWRRLTKETRSDMLVQLDVFTESLWMNEADLERYNVVQQRLVKAKKLLDRLCEQSGLNIADLQVPTAADREKLIGSVIAGCDTLFVSRNSEMYSNEDGFDGRLAKSSVVQSEQHMVVGTPLVLEHYRNEHKKSHNIIVNATAVTIEQLEKYAPWRCVYGNNELVVDEKGQVLSASDLYFDGKALQDTVYQEVEPSQETTQALLEKLFHDPKPLENISPKTQAIYDEIARLKALLVDRSDKNDAFEEIVGIIVQNAGTWKDVRVTDMYSLAEVLHKRRIYARLQNTLPSDSHETKNILESSPEHLIIDAAGELVEVTVSYEDNKAFIEIPTHLAKYLAGVEDQLGDRSVYVWSDSTKKNYLTLHKAIERSSNGNRAERRASDKKSRTSK